MGADALKDLLGADGLTIESVDEAMEKIQNVLQDQKEIEEAMRMDLGEFNDDDIEQELAQLIQQESPSPASIPLPPSPPIELPTATTATTTSDPVNSELSRLNRMFSSPTKKQAELVPQ